MIDNEAQVPPYTLPDPLVSESGQRVTGPQDWPARRGEILRLFEEHVYGRCPAPAGGAAAVRCETAAAALNGLAVRRQVRLRLTDDGPDMDVLLYLPAGAEGPVPLFLGLNFGGNHTVHADPGIWLPEGYVRAGGRVPQPGNRATEAARGSASARWAVEAILQRGYGLGTINYCDIEPDDPAEFGRSVRLRFVPAGQSRPADDQWGAIAAWAWGLSRAADYLETDELVDASRLAVIGHSRLGKTALWASATDPRFALAISNNSGCGGAALSRRCFGETVERINTSFPHWFCGNFKRYNGRESDCPVDQHMLLTLTAPRPLYVASASEDLWADPRGEFLSLLAADPVYRLLGTDGLPATDMPPCDHPVMGTLGYHVRTGGHDVTPWDWRNYLDFADRHLQRTGKAV